MAFQHRAASPLLGTQARHAAHILSVADGGTPSPDFEEVSTSWQRSANRYHVDPADPHAPRILAPHEIKERRLPLDELIETSREEIDALYRLVRDAGYVLLFCDPGGVAVEHRGDERAASEFRYWGTWLGGVWAEDAEGTNGIGTCIVEQRPVTVHHSQHFRSRNKELSCSGAPIFAADGALAAVLDVSAIDPRLSEQAHALTGVLTQRAARAIEERQFRERFRRAWIVAVAPTEGGAQDFLLAVDDDQRILGADRAARGALMLDDAKLQHGISLWGIFERDLAWFRRNDDCDLPARLAPAGGSDAWPALLTPPERALRAPHCDPRLATHTRPRLDSVATLWPSTPPPARGGLPNGAVRRVREYIEAHLSENIDLPTLAALAGLSVFHFARQFKHSTGITPHAYLVTRRIERARELLARSDRTITEIALMTGFADQSHFARQFRQIVGMTPRAFRWSLR
jgi:AraC-like DNA-binding protein